MSRCNRCSKEELTHRNPCQSPSARSLTTPGWCYQARSVQCHWHTRWMHSTWRHRWRRATAQWGTPATGCTFIVTRNIHGRGYSVSNVLNDSNSNVAINLLLWLTLNISVDHVSHSFALVIETIQTCLVRSRQFLTVWSVNLKRDNIDSKIKEMPVDSIECSTAKAIGSGICKWGMQWLTDSHTTRIVSSSTRKRMRARRTFRIALLTFPHTRT